MDSQQQSAEWLHDKWLNGNREGALESLEEFEGRVRLAVLVRLVTLMDPQDVQSLLTLLVEDSV